MCRLCSGVHDRRCYMSCMRSWSVRQRNGFDGGMFCLCCRALPGQHGAHIVLRVRSGLGDERTQHHGCCELHGVCGRAVQRHFYSAVPAVPRGLRDQSTRCCGRNHVHSMRSWHLHPSVDVSMPAVPCWVCYRHASVKWCSQLYGVCGGSLQLAAYRGVRGLCGGAVPGQHWVAQLHQMRGGTDRGSGWCSGVCGLCGGLLPGHCRQGVVCEVWIGHVCSGRGIDVHQVCRGRAGR